MEVQQECQGMQGGEAISKAMAYCLTNGLLSEFNWAGRRDKSGFQGTRMCEMLEGM